MSILLLFCLSLVYPGLVDSQCNKKYFNQSSFVCVCNVFHCDTFQVNIQPDQGTVDDYISNLKEHRLYKTRTKVETLTGSCDGCLRVILNPDSRKQSILGFGGSFTDSSGININSLPAGLSYRLVQDYFGRDGLEYSMARVPIGGSDFSVRPYTYHDDVADLELESFSLTEEDFNYKIPLIKEANELSGGLKLLASVWSPPAWMKYPARLNGTGIMIGDPGGPFYKAFAQYIIKFLEEYKTNGLDIWGITTLNEPSAGLKPGYRFNCLGLSPEMIREWIINDLGPALTAAGYSKERLKLYALDDNVDLLIPYAARILRNSEVSKYLTGFGLHWYENRYFGFDSFDYVHEKFPNYSLITTEACEGFAEPKKGVLLGDWERAENYANDIIGNLNHWSSAWIDWNLALDMLGGPNWVGNVVDAPIIVNSENQEYYKQPMFYALAHFSKFVKPGSQVLDIHIINENSKVKLAAILSPSNEKILIALNRNDHPVNLTIENYSEKPLLVTLGERSIRTMVMVSLD